MSVFLRWSYIQMKGPARVHDRDVFDAGLERAL